jgi:cytochrome c oxidase assembly protein subunit 15
LISSPVTNTVGKKESLKSASRYAWVVVAYNVAVILWGAIVRATGSGAGCGEHWPLCNGTVIQHSPRLDTLIELTHRMTSGIALLAMLVLLVWTFSVTARGHLARVAVSAAGILTLNEALLGALLVLLGKVAHDQSASRAVYLSLHLANTMLLIAALALTAHFLSRRIDPIRGRLRIDSLGTAVPGMLATLFVGVSGSLAALGDTLFPAASLRSAIAEDFSSRSAWLIRIRWLHPTLAVLAGGFICWLVFRSVQHRRNRRLAIVVVMLLAVQYVLGVADLTLLAPVWMQIVHLLGADLLWLTLVVLAARICVVPAEQ